MKPALFAEKSARHNPAAIADGLDTDLTFDGVIEGAAPKIHLPRQLIHRRRPTGRRVFDFATVENAVALLGSLPAQGETWHLAMDTSFNGFDLIAAVMRLAGQPCRELMVATLGTNERAVAGFKQMMEAGQLHKLTVLLSVYFRDADRDACRIVTDQLRAIGATVFCGRIHAKLCLFDFGNKKLVAESSANLRTCRCIEQVTLTQDEPLFYFYRKILKRITTNQRSKR